MDVAIGMESEKSEAPVFAFMVRMSEDAVEVGSVEGYRDPGRELIAATCFQVLAEYFKGVLEAQPQS